MSFVFVPGIQGSTLYDKSDEIVWFPKNSQQLKSLSYINQLKAKEALSSVTAYGIKIATVEIYKGLIDNFAEQERDIYPYDWRQSIYDVAVELADYLKAVRKKTNKPVTIVAHSMGGMVAKWAIHLLEDEKAIDVVNHLITLGTPWYGSPDALKILLYGQPGIYEEFRYIYRYLDRETTRELALKFPSVYQLLPNESYYDTEDGKFYLTSEGDKLLYGDVVSLVNNMYDMPLPGSDVYQTYIKPLHVAMLRQFPEWIEHDCLIGCDIPTLYKVPSKNNQNLANMVQSKMRFKFSPRFGNGDGVVPIDSAVLIDSRTTHYYISGVVHRSMLSSSNVLEFLKWCLNRKMGDIPVSINTTQPNRKRLVPGRMAMVQCPIDLTVKDEQGRFVAGVFDPNVQEISPLALQGDVYSLSVGESNYFYVSGELHNDLVLSIDAFQEGIADVAVQELSSEEGATIQFEAIPVEPGSRAKLIIPASPQNSPKLSLKGTSIEIVEQDKHHLKADIYDSPLPKIRIEFSPADSKKAAYRRVYSGAVRMTISSERTDELEQIVYSIDNESPQVYHGPQVLDLQHGLHSVKAAGKDRLKRPISAVEAELTIVKQAPHTVVDIVVSPDGFAFKVLPQGNGAKTVTKYQIVAMGETATEDWNEGKPGEFVELPWRILAQNPREYVTLMYRSDNEFGLREETKNLRLSLGAIPALMWEENGSYVTPSMIFANLFSGSLLVGNNFKSQLLKQGLETVGPDESIADNVLGVKFTSEYVSATVMFSERYSLYFEGPPTEILKIGEKYKFSFQLRTLRANEVITSTSPRARLHRITRLKKEAIPDQYITLFERNGVYHGEFVVDNSFKQYSYKLMFTDQKNVDPPLRIVALTLAEATN